MLRSCAVDSAARSADSIAPIWVLESAPIWPVVITANCAEVRVFRSSVDSDAS